MTLKQITILDLKGVFIKDFDLITKMDPYLQFYVGKSSMKTQVAEQAGKFPIWTTEITLYYKNESSIQILAFDEDVFSSKYIGEGKIQINTLSSQDGRLEIKIIGKQGQQFGVVTGRYLLKMGKTQGQIQQKNQKINSILAPPQQETTKKYTPKQQTIVKQQIPDNKQIPVKDSVSPKLQNLVKQQTLVIRQTEEPTKNGYSYNQKKKSSQRAQVLNQKKEEPTKNDYSYNQKKKSSKMAQVLSQKKVEPTKNGYSQNYQKKCSQKYLVCSQIELPTKNDQHGNQQKKNSQSPIKKDVFPALKMKKNIENHIFNIQSPSTYKLAYSIPKEPRFRAKPKYQSNALYNIDSLFKLNSSKGVGLGFGNKYQFPKWMEKNMKQNPAPGAYETFPCITERPKGPTFGISHKYYEKVLIAKFDPIKTYLSPVGQKNFLKR